MLTTSCIMIVLSAMSGIAGQEEGVSRIPMEPPDDGIMASNGEIREIETWMRKVFLDESPADSSRIRLDVLRQDHNVLQFGQSCMETPIIIGNQPFEHGLGTHANGEFLVHVPAGAKTFEAFVGIDNNDDTQGQRGTVKFFVQDGDNILFESPVKKGGEDATPVSVQLSPGTKTLLLRTDMTEDGVGHDQCDWADALFVMEDGSIRYLDENQNPLLLEDNLPPFSFRYGDQDGRALVANWERSVTSETTPTATVTTITWVDPATKLAVIAEVKLFTKFPALDWVLYFENRGDTPTPVIADIQALDAQIRTGHPRKSAVLHELEGDACGETSFLQKQTSLAVGNEIRRVPTGGRPSSISAFPWFNFEYNGKGFIGAVGWTGQWASQFTRAQNGPLRTRIGMEKTSLYLNPGERIRSPRVVLMPWEGNRQNAHILWRRFVLFEYVPRLEGRPVQLPVALQTYDRYNSRPGWATEAGQIEAVEAAARLGCDTYWFDAAWFPGGFPNGVGNWIAKPAEFPKGLKPVGDACKEHDMRFVLWFEPERVHETSQIAKEHPEFVHGGSKGGLFKLDDPEARRWLTELLSSRISEYGITVYRNDFNMDPLDYWRKNDPPDRQGITEIRYVEGLYAMWDELLARHPGLWIDNCSSGGRRIDIEMCSRSVPLWRSDTNCWAGHPEWNQAQTASLCLYVPLHTSCAWVPERYTTRSAVTGGLLCQFDYLDKNFPMDEAGMLIKEARHDLFAWYGDFYPLTPAHVAPDEFVAYQFHRPDLDAGVIRAFRRPECRYKGLILEIYGIDTRKDYTVEFIDAEGNSSIRTMPGQELDDSLELKIDEPGGSLLVRYKPDR
jgi:alpha-galactosidase